MMKELHSEFLLAWRCTRTDRKEGSSPSMMVYPSVEYVADSAVIGEFVIRDSDGSEWKATYSNENEQIQAMKDFNQLTAGLIKDRSGQP